MVKCILLSEKLGDVIEIETALGQDIYSLLKGTGTFIGQWPEIEVVIMKCNKSVQELQLNQNILPFPFDKEETLGPILLVKMDEDAEPRDFTLQDWEAAKLSLPGPP